MGTLHDLLKKKILQAQPGDFGLSKTFSEDELSELSKVAEDESSDLDDRVIAARALYNIAENRLIRAQNQVARFKSIWQALEHKKQEQRNINHTTDEIIKKLGNAEGIEAALAGLLELAKAKKESR